MKKITAMALLLSMVLSLSACGDTGSDSSSEETEKTTTAAAAADESKSAETEKPAESEAEPETTTEAVVTEPLNTNVVHAEFANNVLNMSASFDVANIDGFETQEGTQDPDQFIAKGGYGYPDPEWYSSAISIEYRLRPISAYHVEALENKGESYEAYDKVDIGSAY
ncbi:MAG: hypothetical protein IJ806_11920, partial [Ruminococcus sp.]|nr:hypothetical protein [Ruminococcus sp.]